MADIGNVRFWVAHKMGQIAGWLRSAFSAKLFGAIFGMP